MNINTQNAVYTPYKSLLKSFMDSNSPFYHSLKKNLYMFRERERERERERDVLLYRGGRERES